MDYLQALTDLMKPVAGIVSIVATVVGFGGAGIGYFLFRRGVRLERKNQTLSDGADALQEEIERVTEERDRAEELLESVSEILQGENDIWRRRPVEPPEDYKIQLAKSIPIVMFANMKGGVGKTTLAANVAGYFDRMGERVLLIDLDYQGSLSAMVLEGEHSQRDLKRPGAVRLLHGEMPGTLAMRNERSNSALIDCYYPFFNEESRIVYRWMLGELDDDIRYRLGQVLQSTQVQTMFDRVIIDTGPRVTLGFINALCAATHLVVPTQLNSLSIEAVQSFLYMVDEIRPHLMLGLKQYRIAGVQGVYSTGKLTAAEREGMDQIGMLLQRRGEPAGVFFDEAVVAHKTAFAQAAGRYIAYFYEQKVRSDIERLGAEIARFAPPHEE